MSRPLGRLEDETGFSIEVPTGWSSVARPTEGVSYVIIEPDRQVGGTAAFRANLTMTVVSVGGLSFHDWQTGTDLLLPDLLRDYLPIDLARTEVAGRSGGRRLAHHLSAAGEPLTMEQWFALVDDTGYTLTGTVDTWRYDELADLFSAAAASIRLPGDAP